MKQDFYIQIGLTTLRSADDVYFIDVPLFIKVHEIQPNGLARIEENLVHTISEIVAKHNESKIEKIKNQKKEQKENERELLQSGM